MKKVFTLIALVVSTVPAFAQLIMSNALTPTQLVNNILLGSGVTASNIVYTGANGAKASFTCAGSCNLGVSSGILLSSGNAVTSPGGGGSNFQSTDHANPGDAQLDAIVAPRLTEDASILEFDFFVASDSVKFDYVFSSEEYNDYANTSFNDVFAFFISGPGIAGIQNIALIPLTATPVSINTVNNGNSGGVATGPCMNCTYYVDNYNGTSVYFDGFTTVLRASAAVQPCQTYHIKLAIADAGDGVFDSGVFLEGGSFSSLGQITLFANGIPQPDNAVIYACTGSSVDLCLNPATNYNWTNGATTQCITVTEQNINSTGVYNAAIFSPTGCFAFTTNVTVQFITPSATITPSGPTALCPGGNVTLTANAGNTYLWSNGATTQSINVTTAGNYIVTVSNGPNCSAVSLPVAVTVGSATAQITGVLSLCNGANTTLTANAGQSFLWSNGATTQNINVSTAANYTVTVTQVGGCTATATVAVSVNANPTPAITGLLTICQGANTVLNAGAGYTTYLWNNGAATATIPVSASGTYTVTVTTSAGCSASTSAAVAVNPLPVPVIAGTLSFCTGGNSNISVGAGYTGYLWNNGATTSTLNVIAAGNYTVTVTDPNGCSASVSTAITVNPLPVPNITGTFAFCQGANTSIDAGPGYSNYLWSNGAVTQNITVIAGNTYTVTVTDANGCSNNDAQLVTVNPNPVPAIAGTLAICQGANTTLTASAGFSSYSWSTGGTGSTLSVNTTGPYSVTVTDGNGCTGTIAVNVVVNPLPIPAISGTLAFCTGANSNLNAGAGYTGYLWSNGATTQIINVTASGNYIVTVTDPNSCSASTNALVTVNPLPSPNITGIFAICQGNFSSIDAGAGYSNYLWSNGATSQSINVIAANTYTVTVTDGNGCVNSDAQAITINANPVPAISGVNSICQGSSTIFTADPGYSSYSWSTGATSSTLSLTTAGTYTVTVTDANGCTGVVAASLAVNPIPVPAITGTTSFCSGLNSNLNAGAGFNTYLWNTGAVTQVLNVTASGNYQVTVTNAFNCSASTNSIVTVNPLPLPAITGPAAICAGNNATLDAGAGYASYLWSNGAITQTINTGAAGNYTVTVTSAAGCPGSDGAVLIINPLPVPSITGVTTICQGASTILDAGAGYSNYSWSTGATTQTITTGLAGSVNVTVTDANGCSAPAAASVTVNPLPVPVITGVNAFCQGQSSVLDAGVSFASYLWNTGAVTRSIPVSTGGNYTVTVSSVIGGCLGDDDELVTVNQNPVPVINGGTGICQGTSTNLTVPGSYATYLWNTGATTSSISVNTAGNYTVTVSSSFGCVGSSGTAMVINPLPSPVINGITSICQGTTTSFNAGAGYSAYLWSNGSTSQSIAPGSAGTYTVTVTDINGCQNNTNIALTVNPLPTPVIAGDFEFCLGATSNINAGAGYSGYLWNDGSTTQVINVSTAGSYIVTVTDGNGCTASTSSTIIVDPLPTPSITGNNAICQGTTTTFNAGNYASYLWSTGASTSNITIGSAGTYAVTVTDVNGCVNSTSESLTVYQLPTAAISGVSAICFGEASSINLDFTGAPPFIATYTNGITNTPYASANLSAVVNVAPGITTNYSLLTISDIHCVGTVSGSAMVTVNPLPLPLISGDLAICDGETTSLSATPGFTAYTWSNSNSQSSINTGTGGIYTVTVTDNNGCIGTSAAVNLVVNMVPVVAFTNDTSLTCSVPQINFTNLSQYDAGSVFEWSFGDGSSAANVSPSHLYFAPGNYPVSLVITTPAGCTSNTSSQVEIMFFPLPEADFVTAPGIGNVFNGKIAFVDRSDFAVSWLWDFGDGNKSIEQNPEHYYDVVGDYRVGLTITNIAGCVDYYEEVVVINPYYIPNAFTPNGDGVNDLFYYSGYDLDVANYNMKIFNRWGQLVFAAEDENDNWNGFTIDGVTAPQGTYVYRLEVKTKGGKEYVFDGRVNLIR